MKTIHEVKIVDGSIGNMKAWVVTIKKPDWWNFFSKITITKERAVCNQATGFSWVGEKSGKFEARVANQISDALKDFREPKLTARSIESYFDF